MALPTPLTSAQVGGSNDDSELRASFVTGPNAGMVLLVSKSDPDLEEAVQSGNVVVENPGEFAPRPLFASVTPNTSPSVSGVTFLVVGERIPLDVFVEVGEQDVEDLVVTPTSITGTVDLTGVGPLDGIIAFWIGQEMIDFLPFTVTAAP